MTEAGIAALLLPAEKAAASRIRPTTPNTAESHSVLF
jgi:hypothetical protein